MAVRLGNWEARIVRVLWDRKKATAREITDALNEQGGRASVSHSTVQTLLRRLERKGIVGHSEEGRIFVFHPIQKPEKLRSGAIGDLVSRLFNGSATELVSHLLKSKDVSKSELDALAALIEEHRRREEE